MTKVSAIVSAYYAVDYLQGRLDNLFTQEPTPEIVVVCQEGSGEHQIAKDFGNGVVIVTTPDIPTIYDAWNMGIKASSGEYLTNANTDDRLLPGALAKMSEILDIRTAVALVYGNQDIVKEIGGEVTGKFEWAEGKFDKLLQGCFVSPMPMWRRSLHDKYGYFDPDLKVAGDYDFWLKIAKGGERFFHLKETIGIYLDSRTSAEHRQKNLTAWETARVRGRYRKGIGIWDYNI